MLRLRGKQTSQEADKRGKIFGNRPPHNPRVNSEVIVDDAVTHAAHIRPGDSGDAPLDVSRNVLSGFADDSQVADHRIDVFSSFANASKEDPAV